MSAFLGKAGKKLFEKHLQQYTPADPLYETYTTDKGKQKRRKRALPPGLSERDARILTSVKKHAHYLDKGFSICGMRFGWTFFIGLVPIVGDVTDASLNYLLVIRPARKADIPTWLVERMLLNNALSVAVGFVPVVGDVVMAMFKTNSRNAALLEEFLRIRGEEFLKLGGTAEPTHSSTWFGKSRKAKKDTRSGKNSASAGAATDANAEISATDVEQVKPGAGMSGTEMKESLPSAKAPHSGSSSFTFFGGRHKKTTPPVSAHADVDQSRFVEDMDGPMPDTRPAKK